MKKRILIVMGRFLPGYKDGGPVRTIINLIDHLGDEFEFRILTTDRDHGDDQPYSGIIVNEWNKVHNVLVMYVKPGGFTKEIIIRAASEMELIYMCGCFNDYARVVLSVRKRLRIPIIIASMGLFSEGAFSYHKWKKMIYIELLRQLGMFNQITWSATSHDEVKDIRRIIGSKAICCVAQDLPRVIKNEHYIKTNKKRGALRVCFLSRIDPQKNLLYVIEQLSRISGEVSLDIYGAIHVQEYWDECQDKLEHVNFSWKYHGEVNSEDVIATFSKHELFFFPTKGENYGHVVVEALSAGRPVVLSDQTPWKDFEELGIGAVLSLKQEKEFQDVLQNYIGMGQDEFNEHCYKAFEYAKTIQNNNLAKEQYRNMFLHCI